MEDGVDAGVNLVLAQRNPMGDRVWHLHQDLVLALGLIEENDAWAQPDENFTIAAKRVRRPDGSVSAILIRTDLLRDYLYARGLALRLLTYRERVAIQADADHIQWSEGRRHDALVGGRFEGRVMRIHPGGDLEDAMVAVFLAWRTDADAEADVPIMGPRRPVMLGHTLGFHAFRSNSISQL